MAEGITIPKWRKGNIVRKYWTKAKLKASMENSKVCISRSDVKALFRPPTLFSFADCSTLLSLRLFLHLVNSFPQKTSHNLGISRIWPHLAFLSLQRKITQPFFVSLTLKPESCGAKVAKFCCLLGWNLAPSFKYIFYQLSVFHGFLAA
jgi:hypothetical protein